MILAGSLTFGLEAFLIALGGRMITAYKRDRGRVLGFSFLLGLILVLASIISVYFLGLEVIYLPVFLIFYILISGKVLGFFGNDIFDFRKSVPKPSTTSGEDMRTLLEVRGFEGLISGEDEED